MPLLRRQPFQKDKQPPDLDPEEEVFHCKLTNEVFRDYEKFFERIILCNSLVWSCAITGRSGLTYQEAEECEEKALKQLASFPAYLQKPILYLVTKTQRSRLADLNDDIFSFAKDRYFIGEMVEVLSGSSSTRKSCKVLNVIPPGSSKPSSPAAAVNGDPLLDGASTSSPDKRLAKKMGKPENYSYVVQEPGKSSPSTVKFKMISRKKGLFTRDKCKLFLKQSCDSIDGVWRVKAVKAKKFELQTAQYEDIYVGPLPQFEFSEIKVKKAAKKPESKEASPAPQPKKQKLLEKDEKKGPQTPVLTLEEIRMLREQERLIREREKEEKLAQKTREREEIRKKFEEEKKKRQQEKAMEVEKKREERRIQAELWREWSRFRDDLDCDDLKVMPEPTPVKCRIPVEEFGDAIMVVEFVNCFGALFDLRSSFPKGFTLRTLEEALLETDAGGLMADLLLMMLTAIFSLQEEEEEEEAELQKEQKEQAAEAGLDEKNLASDMSVNQLIEAATNMSHLPQLAHGSTLRKLPLDNFTLTEILRLHILASGAPGNQNNAKFRYQQRGGYMPIDDAGLDFKRRSPEIVSKLALENIYDLPPNYKLQIMKVLVDQFLTYAASRDMIEDNNEKLKQLRNDLKQLQWGEQRREREEAATRYRVRMEEKQKERDILEKKRLLKIKQREEQLKSEAAKNGGEPGQVPMETQMNVGDLIEVTEEEILELERALPTQEERENRQKEEDDEEADRKAEYMAKERDFLENILALQHGNAIYPVGRDRMYRRYWIFKSVPGLFVEDDDDTVSEEALKPCSQNPEGSAFDLSSPFAMPPKLQMNKQAAEPQQQTMENKEGSDKENDSMNASALNNSVLNDSTASQSRQLLTNSSVVGSANDSVAGTESPAVKTEGLNGDSKPEAMIVISDDEDSNKLPSLEKEKSFQPPTFVETPAIAQMKGNKHKWAYFKTEEELELLINCLNGRGIREKALKNSLLEHKNVLMEKISEVPEDLLTIPGEDEDMKDDLMMSPQLKTREWRRGRRNVTGTVKNDSAHEGLELNLREMILDLEERIHVGSLGYIRVKDRTSWRDAIENGSYVSQSSDPAFVKEKPAEKKEVGEAMDTSSSEEENSNITISQDMAKAVVQIARGIERRFLKPPLGDEEALKPTKSSKKTEGTKKEEQKKGKKKEKEGEEESDGEAVETSTVSAPQKTVIERWEDSCLLCTSLAQVFLHLSTLEKSVIWAKSLLHTRCRICRRKCDPDKLLLCDQCDRGHHLYCLKPPLKQVPTGDWFCPECKPKESKRSPVKKRRQTFSERVSSDEEEEQKEESEEEEDAEDEASSGEEENDPICAVCSHTGTLICCDHCPLSYHLACADPPLKKVPKGKWLCQVCAFTDTKAGKIKMNLVKGKGGKKKNSPKTTPSSSKQSSRRGSPRDSPLTVEATKKRKRSDSPLLDQTKMKLKRNAKSASKLSLEPKKEPKNELSEAKQYTSSSRGSSQVQQLKMLEDMVVAMIEEEEAWPFARPVQKKDAPDYHEVIKKPMDFQTIKNKINKFMYTEPADLVSDVRLIFTNCIEYNKRTTPEFKAGANLSKSFEKKLKNLWETAESNGPSSKRARTK